MERRHMDQDAYLEHIRQGFHEVLKKMADIVESLGEHSTGGPGKAPQNEKAHE